MCIMQYNVYYYTCELALFNAAHEMAYENICYCAICG